MAPAYGQYKIGFAKQSGAHIFAPAANSAAPIDVETNGDDKDTLCPGGFTGGGRNIALSVSTRGSHPGSLFSFNSLRTSMADSKRYFSHDLGARNDPKMVRLQRSMGHEGKGIYWDIIEQLYENDGYLLLLDVDDIAFAMHLHPEKLQMLINSSGLLQQDGTRFWSEAVLERIELRKNISKTRSETAKARWDEQRRQQDDANAMQMHSKGNAINNINKGNGVVSPNGDTTGDGSPPDSAPPTATAADYAQLEPKDSPTINGFITTHRPKFAQPYADLWNLYAKKHGNPCVQKINAERLRKLQARLRDKDFDLYQILMKAAGQKFLHDKGWFSFDWLITNDTHAQKVLDGAYIQEQQAASGNGQPNPESMEQLYQQTS